MKDKFTILIQGPLNEDSLQNIPNYLKFGKEVIVSHWDSDDLSLIQKYQQDNVRFLSQKLPDPVPRCCNFKPLYWMFLSTYLGLNHCKTKYVIKVRGDEYFSDLNKMCLLLLQNDRKVVHGNIFSQLFKKHPYHFGDHIFAARTELLLKAHKKFIIMYQHYNTTKTLDPAFQLGQGWCPEQILSATIFRQRGIYVSKNHLLSPEVLKEYIAIIDINRLGNYKVRWNHKKKEWINNYQNESGVNTIEDIFK